MKGAIILILTPMLVLSQQVLIKQLPDSINTDNAEINFIQVNDSTAYFTVISETEDVLVSNIYSSNFLNGEWKAKQFTKYNSDILNTANISLLDSGRIFLTAYGHELLDCEILYTEHKNPQVFFEISALNSDNFFNTQPSIALHNFQKVLYFVSDRKGGFGGLDIWLTIIDINGNFGVPVNAGSKINSSSDEVTPFYNRHSNMIYFSSNRETGAGGFDIFKAEGSLNYWNKPLNVEELNTTSDDLYATFYDENNGYFSSNRKGVNFNSDKSNYCCNDIFSFQYTKPSFDTIRNPTEIHKYLPLDLYFHNDEPDSRTMNIKTNKTYKEAYISYFMMKSDYENKNPNLKNFFKDILQNNFNKLNNALDILYLYLSNGIEAELVIRGYASPLYSSEYNQNLSQRRISSVINYLTEFKNGVFKDYIFSQNLIINELSFGESSASEKTSDDINDKKESIYSIEAILERKIQIVDVILK